jgi:anti-sigma factor RsiW
MTTVELVPAACQNARRYVDSYIDNELTIDGIHQVLPHLESCTACQAYFEDRRRLKAAVKRAVLTAPLPAAGSGGSMVQDSAEQIAWLNRTLDRDRAISRRNLFVMGSGALAAGLAGFGVFRNWQHSQRDSAEMTRFLAAAVLDHKHCAVAGYYPDTPPAEAEMAEALGPAYAPLIPVVRELSTGYTLQEGHRCRVGGREFIHFILKNGGTLVSLSSFERLPRDPQLPVSQQARDAMIDGFAASGFVARRHIAAIVTAEPAEARRIAGLFAPGAFQIL